MYSFRSSVHKRLLPSSLVILWPTAIAQFLGSSLFSLYRKAFQANEFRSATAVISRKHRRGGLSRPKVRQFGAITGSAGKGAAARIVVGDAATGPNRRERGGSSDTALTLIVPLTPPPRTPPSPSRCEPRGRVRRDLSRSDRRMPSRSRRWPRRTGRSCPCIR
jgi:hypothetical protein